MALKTQTRPDVAAAATQVLDAANRYNAARDHLLQLETADPRERSLSTWVTSHESTRREVVESAQDLEEARRLLIQAETDDLAWNVAEYRNALPDIRRERHDLAVELEGHLAEIDRLADAVLRLCERERMAAIGAKVSGPDLDRIRRTLISRLAYTQRAMRLRTELRFTAHPHSRKTLGEVFMSGQEAGE